MNAASLIQAVTDRFPEAVKASHAYRGDATVVVSRESLLEVARTLKEDPAFQMNFLMDLTAVDFSTFGTQAVSGLLCLLWRRGDDPRRRFRTRIPGPARSPVRRECRAGAARFVVVYHFFSLPLKHRLRLEVPVEEVDEADPEVDSLTSLWAGADWLEREVWDMFGIRFRGHPNLKRILMYEEFVGHPLRKDYAVNKRQPLIGPVN